jgi:hypothetical protein
MERPSAITALGSISTTVGILMLAGGAFLLIAGALANTEKWWGYNVFMGAFGVLIMVTSIPQIVIGVGLLRMKNWARVLALICSVVSLFGLMLDLKVALQHPLLSIYSIAQAAFDVWLLVYLLSPRVKQAFGATGI